MSKHRKSKRNRIARAAAVVAATGSAALVTAPLAFAAAPTVVYVDGTKPIIPGSSGEGAADLFGGAYNLPGWNKVTVSYPRSFGVLTGTNDPGYDQSVATGQANTVAAIKQARANNPGMPIIVVSVSQGADAASRANAQLEAEGFDTSNVFFVMAGNPDRADGGILTRFPGPGVYVPGVGITLGGQAATSSSGAQIVQVTRQYDGIADAPKYWLNPVADLNAVVGAYYLHGTYSQVIPNDPTAIVSTTPDGKVIDVLIPTKTVPLLMLAEDLGLPKPVAEALDPITRAIIETGYGPRPSGPGTYPTEAVTATLLPPPSEWAWDAQTVAQGAVQTGQAFANLANPGSAGTLVPSVPSITNAPAVSPAPTQGQSLVSTVTEPLKTTHNSVQNVLRPSLSFSPGGSSPSVGSGSPGGSNPVGAAVGGITKAVTDTVTNVVKSVTGGLSSSSTSTSSTSSSS